MADQRLGGGNPAFAPGEAEEMVRELRGHLRLEQELRARGELEGAARAAMRATSLTGALARRLERRFERQARAYCGGDAELVDQAVSEMFHELCRRVRDTTANDAMERRFNLVVKALVIDAVRKVRAQHGLTKHGGPATHHVDSADHDREVDQPGRFDERDGRRYRLMSLEAASARAEAAAEGERAARPLEIADPDADEEFARALERVVGRALGPRAIGWLQELPARQRGVVEDRILSEPAKSWAETAARAGVSSVRTAQTDLERALGRLRELYAGHERP